MDLQPRVPFGVAAWQRTLALCAARARGQPPVVGDEELLAYVLYQQSPPCGGGGGATSSSDGKVWMHLRKQRRASRPQTRGAKSSASASSKLLIHTEAFVREQLDAFVTKHVKLLMDGRGSAKRRLLTGPVFADCCNAPLASADDAGPAVVRTSVIQPLFCPHPLIAVPCASCGRAVVSTCARILPVPLARDTHCFFVHPECAPPLEL